MPVVIQGFPVVGLAESPPLSLAGACADHPALPDRIVAHGRVAPAITWIIWG
ncbi:hypothetical protein [Xanthomonas cannabis]|uniref:hypothetical protein n=1 Tax=Xanthomonas cannabis TaxID=1885674 RepID=UPI000A5F51E9|nr:hypothetical protein [Xanthomonas cannabis]